MNANKKMFIGIFLMIIGLLMPIGLYPVLHSDWPIFLKTLISGILTFGFEIMAIPAIAIMGKENFNRIVNCSKKFLCNLKPTDKVSSFRYYTGLVMLMLSLVPNYIMAYLPQWLPDVSPTRLFVNIGADLFFLISLFVLGGDFWDKLKALFIKDAKAVFPQE